MADSDSMYDALNVERSVEDALKILVFEDGLALDTVRDLRWNDIRCCSESRAHESASSDWLSTSRSEGTDSTGISATQL